MSEYTVKQLSTIIEETVHTIKCLGETQDLLCKKINDMHSALIEITSALMHMNNKINLIVEKEKNTNE